MQDSLIRFYRYAKKNWNSIVAVISIVGFLIFFYVPPLREYSFWFAFLAANAIIWTLIELKIKLFVAPPSDRYVDMRTARSEIIQKITDAMTESHKDMLQIWIIGGRIRTISDILREIKNDILNERLQARNVHFSVFCIDPNFLTSWNFNGVKNIGEFNIKCKRYASMINHFSSELDTYNTLDQFVKNCISLEVFHYKCLPSFYAFLIGNSSLFWGFFTWNQAIEDFEGPENPCFFLDKSNGNFGDFHDCLVNRAEFLKTNVGTKYEVNI